MNLVYFAEYLAIWYSFFFQNETLFKYDYSRNEGYQTFFFSKFVVSKQQKNYAYLPVR